jgi:hypothetical protein
VNTPPSAEQSLSFGESQYTEAMATTKTKGGIIWLDENINQVKLPNGRKIDVTSREGADDFIETVGTDFISTSLTAADDNELTCAYIILIKVTCHASPTKIASGIPGSELRTFIEHTRDALKTLSADRDWLCWGAVSMCPDQLLKAVACFSEHPSFLKLFLSNEGMEALAMFYASRKKNSTPSRSVAQSIINFVGNTLTVLGQEGVSFKEGFGTMEKAGLLGQLIRCIPVDPDYSADVVMCLQACMQLVKKKLKSGTRTGDILDAVIAGKDGPINEKVKADLTKLQTLARISNSNKSEDSKDVRMCRHCLKTESLDGAKLMKCQRCKVTYYCNKVCQAADWKSHKKQCKAMANVSPSVQKTLNTAMWAFVETNYFDIAKEVYKKTQEYNVPKKELFLEIDFCLDAPALRNEFKVRLTSDFFEESVQEDAPDWFRTYHDKKLLTRSLRRECERSTSDDLLAVCILGSGRVTIETLRLAVEDASYPLFSDEAVESIGSEDYVRMVACLGPAVTSHFVNKRSGLR